MQHAEINVSARICRLACDRTKAGCKRLVITPERIVHLARIGMKERRLWRERDRLFDPANGVFKPTPAKRNDAHLVERRWPLRSNGAAASNRPARSRAAARCSIRTNWSGGGGGVVSRPSSVSGSPASCCAEATRRGAEYAAGSLKSYIPSLEWWAPIAGLPARAALNNIDSDSASAGRAARPPVRSSQSVHSGGSRGTAGRAVQIPHR